METLKNSSQPDKGNGRIVKKTKAGKLSKLILVFFMLSWLTLLSSCFFPCGGVVRDGHREHHGWHHDHGYNR